MGQLPIFIYSIGRVSSPGIEQVLVGHRSLAGSIKSSHCDYRLIILCAVGTLLARGAGLALRPHRDRKCRSTDIIMMCGRNLTGTCIQEEPKHRKDLECSASLRSDLVRKAASERGGTI